MDAPELGKLLCDEGVLTPQQLKQALEFQKEVGGRLPVILVKLGHVSERELLRVFAKLQDLPIVDLDELILPVNLIRRLPRDVMERHQVLPVGWNQETQTLTVATFDPYDVEALEELQIAVDCRVVINLAPRSQIVRVLNDFFYREEQRLKQAGTQEDRARETPQAWKEALVPLLIEKKVVSAEELDRKARQMGLLKGDGP